MSRAKQQRLDEKHEKILRAEAKKSCNLECFDCLQKGPFSIVMQLGTFVCNDCAGIHRGSPFNHQIKSISTSSFKPNEISNILNNGGNDRAARIWIGKLTNQRKPRVGDTRNILKFMEQKYIKKQFYVPPEVASVPQEDLSDTGVLDQIPTPPISRTRTTNQNTSKTSDNVFDFSPPSDNSFFSNNTNNTGNNTGNSTSLFQNNQVEKPKSSSSGASLLDLNSPQEISPTKPQELPQNSNTSSLLDLGNDGFGVAPQPTPVQNNSSANSLLGIDFSSNSSSQTSYGSNPNMFNNQPIVQNNNTVPQSNLFDITPSNNQSSSTMNYNNNTNNQNLFGNTVQTQQNMNFGANAQNQSGLFGQQMNTVQPNQNKSLFDSITTSQQQSSLFDTPSNPNQHTNNSSQVNNPMMTHQPLNQQQGNMGFGNNVNQQQMNPIQQNNYGNTQNMNMNNNMQQNIGFNTNNQQNNQVNPNMTYGGNQQSNSMLQQQQNQGCTTEQLNFMQQKFVEKLKTLPPAQQQQMGSQYQQWNMQLRMQFLMKNFGHLIQQTQSPSFEPFTQIPNQQTNYNAQSQMVNQQTNYTQTQIPKQQEKGKYANMFSDLDILNKRK